jgi:excisionase family DNA binding protein
MSENADDRIMALEQLQREMRSSGRTTEADALEQVIAATRSTSMPTSGGATAAAMTSTGGARLDSALHAPSSRGKGTAKTYLKLKKKYYTPAEVARRVGVSRQTIVKWIERGELEAELTPGGHHRIPASVFHREGRGEAVQLIPVDESGD